MKDIDIRKLGQKQHHSIWDTKIIKIKQLTIREIFDKYAINSKQKIKETKMNFYKMASSTKNGKDIWKQLIVYWNQTMLKANIKDLNELFNNTAKKSWK